MKKKSTVIYIIIAVVVLAIIGASLYFILNRDTTNLSEGTSENSVKNENTASEQNTSKSIKNEVITAENYEKLMNQAEQEFTEDDEEIYYLSYAVMYYIMTDGMEAALSGSEDESEMYVNIYGKTVQQLIDEGKQLMEENNVSLDELEVDEKTNQKLAYIAKLENRSSSNYTEYLIKQKICILHY